MNERNGLSYALHLNFVISSFKKLENLIALTAIGLEWMENILVSFSQSLDQK